VRYLIELGIVPVNLLSSRFKLINCVRFPIEFGIVPERAFTPRFSICNLMRPPILSGIVPLKLLSARFNIAKSLRFPIESGICPPNGRVFVTFGPLFRFELARNILSDARLPMQGGREPENLLRDKSNSSTDCILQIECGIVPFNRFEFKNKC